MNELQQGSELPFYPVIVVGAGPTGLTLANLLGRYGVHTLVLERNSATVQEPRAVSIDDESLRTMQMIGLEQEVLSECALDYGSVYLDIKGKPFARIEPKVNEFGFPRRSAFIQPTLEATLRDGLKRYQQVEARFGHNVVAFQQQDGIVTLTVAHAGEQYQVQATYVAAADGGRSYFRSGLNIVLEGLTYEQKWLIIDLAGSRDNYRQTRVYCDPGRPGINLPGPRGNRRFEFMLLPGENDEAVVEENFVRNLVANYGPDRDAKIVRKQVYTFHARKAQRWREDGIFLLGDAAHLTPPFAGQGMNSGLRDAANLGWKLSAVIKGQLSPSLLDTYEIERKPHAWQLIEMAAMLGRFMMPPTRLQAWLLQTGLRILSLYKPARDYVTQMRYKPAPRFVSGWFVPDGENVRKTRSGRMFPQPALESVERRIAKMDDCVHDGFLLLAYNSNPANAFTLIDDEIKTLPFNVEKICITPRQYNPVATQGMKVFRDARSEAYDWIFKGHENSLFLLRPDRYVMAVISADNINQTLPQLRQLMANPLS